MSEWAGARAVLDDLAGSTRQTVFLSVPRRERSICIDCHKVGGVGGDPHPAGWTNRHPRDEINRNPMCLTCHL